MAGILYLACTSNGLSRVSSFQCKFSFLFFPFLFYGTKVRCTITTFIRASYPHISRQKMTSCESTTVERGITHGYLLPLTLPCPSKFKKKFISLCVHNIKSSLVAPETVQVFQVEVAAWHSWWKKGEQARENGRQGPLAGAGVMELC